MFLTFRRVFDCVLQDLLRISQIEIHFSHVKNLKSEISLNGFEPFRLIFAFHSSKICCFNTEELKFNRIKFELNR